METVLVTGSSGGIGRILVSALCENGYRVIGLDISEPPQNDFNIINFKFILGSILEPDRYLGNYLSDINHVVHLAAISSLPECESDPHKAFEVNFLGLVKVVEFISRTRIKNFINASTSAVYEGIHAFPFRESDNCNPHLVYPQTKLMGEKFLTSQVLTRGFPATSLRLFNVVGPFQDYSRISPPLLNYLIREYLSERKPILHSDGNQERDYISVYEVCNAIQLLLSSHPGQARVFNICSGETLSVREIDEIVRNFLSTPIRPDYRGAEKLWDKYPKLYQGNYPISSTTISDETNKRSVGSAELFKQTTGWSIKTPIEEAIIQICQQTIVHIKGIEK